MANNQPMMQNAWANAKQAAMNKVQSDMANQVQDDDKAMMEQMLSKIDQMMAMMQTMMRGGMGNG